MPHPAAPLPVEVNVMAAPSASSANTGGLPSDPSLYSTVGDPSALQSIVTLNITNASELNLLLAGLIDNTTGGPNSVNGTLESITYQVGSLGLNTAVVNALGNQIAPSDGLYKAPASSFPKKQPSSLWGAFWNAVTNFVTNPLGAILSLVNTVWDAARAAFTYLDHLATEAAAIGGEIASRVAGALVAVGKAIASGFEALLSYVTKLVHDLLAAAIDPVEGAAKGYVSNVGTTFNLTLADVENGGQNNGNVKASDAARLLEALSGNVMILATAVGVATTIAFALLTPLDFGASFMVGIILGLVTVVGLMAFAGLAAAAAFTEAAAWEIDNFVNLTITKNSGTIPQMNWKAFAESLGLAGAITDTPLAIYLGVIEAESPSAQLLWPGLSMTFDMLSIVILMIAWAASSLAIAMVAMVFASVGLLLSFASAKQAATKETYGLLNSVDLVLGSVGVGTALYDLLSSE
ncbi:MAG: hypothetical protein ACYDFT_07025 [Thermoplasmata archaeon]